MSDARSSLCPSLFFFNDTATTEIYPLSLHDALPISSSLTSRPKRSKSPALVLPSRWGGPPTGTVPSVADRKSTRLNSSHQIISYAVFCLKKKKKPSKKSRSPLTSPPPHSTVAHLALR